jgi:anti-anti-sigma regulatory factor
MTGDSAYTLKISGDADLRNVQDIIGQLRQALENHNAITVVTDGLTSIDITILQLLVAARKSALASGKTLTLHAPADGVLHRLLVQTGFVSTDGKSLTPEGEFWTKTSATELAA